MKASIIFNKNKNIFSQIKQLIILIPFFLGSNLIHAITVPKRDYQVWDVELATGTLKYPLKYWIEMQQRYGDGASRVSQNLIRPALGYMLTKDLSLWTGYAWISSTLPFTSFLIEENRIWQQLLWSKTIDINKFTSRTRLEERFIQKTLHTAYRFRQQEKVEIPLRGKFSIIGADEIFIHLNNFNVNRVKGFDQNRAFAGFGYRPKKEVLFELGYMNQFIRRPARLPNYMGSILCMSVILSLE